MVITAFTTKSREDLDRLARDIATQHDGDTAPAAIEALPQAVPRPPGRHRRHAQLLNTSLDDTTAALKLVNAQLASLLVQVS